MSGETEAERGSAHKAFSVEELPRGGLAGASFPRPRKLEVLGLVAILAVAALLRVPALTSYPPGLNQDEAANAWNAWCLLKTGHDQVGQSWPVFCFRALGEYRSALFLYLMLPFQALGGLNVWTTRLPSAFAGLASIALAWWVARRLFGPRVALVTAALLAVAPSHIQISRMGHEASLTPLLTLAPLALLIWAGFPPVDLRRPTAGLERVAGPQESLRPEQDAGAIHKVAGSGGTDRLRTGPKAASAISESGSTSSKADSTSSASPVRAVIAGLVIGICCYGYPAARLFIPVFLVLCVAVTISGWRRLARSRRGRLALVALAVGFCTTFGPLAWQHLVHPETIGRRGHATWIWRVTDPAVVRVAKVVVRYCEHFGPDFLYFNGDTYDIVWAVGTGYIPLPLLPLQIVALVLLVRHWRDSAAARVLLMALLAYPVGDSFNWHGSMQGLRSSPGLFPLLTLAGLGLVWLAGSLRHARQQAALIAVGAALVLHLTGFANRYLFVRPRDLPVYAGTHGDLLAAGDFLAPRLKRGDIVIISDRDMNQPYVVWLVAMKYDPRRWFAEPREVQPYGDWDRYTRCGNTYFVHGRERAALIESLRDNGQTDHVYSAVHPGERAPGRRIGEIAGPDQVPALLVYEAWL